MCDLRSMCFQSMIKPLRCLFSCCVRAIDMNLNSTPRKCAAGHGSLYWWQGSCYHYQHEGLAPEPSGLPSWPGWARHVYSQALRVATPVQPLRPLWPKSSESNHHLAVLHDWSSKAAVSDYRDLSSFSFGGWCLSLNIYSTDSFAFTYKQIVWPWPDLFLHTMAFLLSSSWKTWTCSSKAWMWLVGSISIAWLMETAVVFQWWTTSQSQCQKVYWYWYWYFI